MEQGKRSRSRGLFFVHTSCGSLKFDLLIGEQSLIYMRQRYIGIEKGILGINTNITQVRGEIA
jgi:hypothetical protein